MRRDHPAWGLLVEGFPEEVTGSPGVEQALWFTCPLAVKLELCFLPLQWRMLEFHMALW